MTTTITAIGGKKSTKPQSNQVLVTGLGKATVAITFDGKEGKIIEIEFNNERPPLKKSTRKQLEKKKTSDSQEICHKESVLQIKQNIKEKHIGKSTSDFRAGVDVTNKKPVPNSDAEYKNTTKKIAEQYLELSRRYSNLFIGDTTTNHNHGKLAILLGFYIDNKEKFIHDDIKNILIPKGNNFYSSLIEKYPTSSIPLDGSSPEDRWNSLQKIWHDINHDDKSKHFSALTEEEPVGMLKYMDNSNEADSDFEITVVSSSSESESGEDDESDDEDTSAAAKKSAAAKPAAPKKDVTSKVSSSSESDEDDESDNENTSASESDEDATAATKKPAAKPAASKKNESLPTSAQPKFGNHRNTIHSEAARLASRGTSSLQNNSNKRDDDVKSSQSREKPGKRR